MDVLKTLPSALDMSKNEIINLLLREEYGFLPPSPYSVTAETISHDKNFCAGKAELLKLSLCCKASFGEFSFPVYYARQKEKKHDVPCFIHINFRDLIPDRYQPTEEIISAGYSTLTFCYKDVTSDDGDFSNGLAGKVYNQRERKPDECGKIGLWAWAAMAVLDYAQTLDELDRKRISVVGHSRLGKTALLAGALDERFYCAISNDSGCSGAALSRETRGETVANIVDVFPFWFCENYKKYVNNESALPFDQHFLIAANAPHKVYVASANEDQWAYPPNEYLSCVAASKSFEAAGLTGFVHPERLPNIGEYFHDGNIAYHLRAGTHYLGRDDWNLFIKYLSEQK